MEGLIYLLKVAACTVLFFGFYLLFLRKLTFFKINRFYLLITLLLSFIIPTLQFEVKREIAMVDNEVSAELPEIKPINQPPVQLIQPVMVEYEPQVVNRIDWWAVVSYAYAGVASLLVMICLWRLFNLIKHTKGYTKNNDGLKLVTKTKGFTNCSFFNYVFIDGAALNASDLAVLLKHEQVHAKQYHSIDKIILMIFKSILWFNPIVYLYDKALEQVHEYEADEITSNGFGNQAYANLLLKLAISKNDMPLIHNFVKSPIKDRIKMLFHSKSKNMKKLMYLLALPVGLLLIWSFTIKVTPVFTKEKVQEKIFTLVIDAAHGGVDDGAVVGNIKEKELTLAIAQKIKIAAVARGFNVVLTRTDDQTLNVQKRAAVKGDFLISLKLSADVNTNKNGIRFLTSGRYERDYKLPKSNSMTYYIYKSIENIKGIKVDSEPKLNKIALIDSSSKPGIVITLGYLTNKSDFNFITDDGKQTLLADKIVEGIMQYKKITPSDETLATRQKEVDSVSKSHQIWLKSAKYKALASKAAKIGRQSISGKIESLHFFGKVNPRIDGFILDANGTKYRVYINPVIMKKTSYQVGDHFVVKVNKAEVWYDSDYLVLQPDPKALEINSDGAILNKGLAPKIISYSKMKGDIGTKTYYMDNAVMEVLNHRLEAEYITFDKANNKIMAKNGILKSLDGKSVVKATAFYLDLNKGVFTTNNVKGEYHAIGLSDINNIKEYLIKASDKVEYVARDSVKMSKDKSIVSLFGNARLFYNEVKLSGSKIVYNKNNNTVFVNDASMTSGDNKINADSLFFDIKTKKAKLFGADLNR